MTLVRDEQHLRELLRIDYTPAQMAAITALGRPDGRLFGGDPDSHEEM